MKFSRRILSMILVVVMTIGSMAICVSASEPIKQGVAFVDASALNMRSKASTGSSVRDIAYRDEVVVILGKSGDWYHVIYNLQEGYMHRSYLNVKTAENVELGYGKINSYLVNLRSGPSTSTAIVAQAQEGAKAYIIGINNGWYKVIFQDKTCYVRSDLLDLTEYPYENRDSSNSPKYFIKGEPIEDAPVEDEEKPTEPAPEQPTEPAPEQPTEPAPEEPTQPAPEEPADPEPEETVTDSAIVTASALYLREKPTTSSKSIGMAYRGERVGVISKDGDWYKVIYKEKTGYMHGDYLTIVNDNVSGGQKLVECAKQYLGVPYVWGGSSPSGFDCSGFVQYVARQCGYTIGRTVSQQWPYGVQVSRSELKPGDIVFFANTYTSGLSHVGIYVGDGQFIHASSNGGVMYSDLNSNYYSSHYYGARRLG